MDERDGLEHALILWTTRRRTLEREESRMQAIDQETLTRWQRAKWRQAMRAIFRERDEVDQELRSIRARLERLMQGEAA